MAASTLKKIQKSIAEKEGKTMTKTSRRFEYRTELTGEQLIDAKRASDELSGDRNLMATEY